MKVHYSPSLWGKGKGRCGSPQYIHWQFEHAGSKRCIPAIYHFPKGIVFDIITFLDEAQLRTFIDKYKAVEDELTPLQKRCLKQEHPYQAVPIKEIWINGKQAVSGYSSSSAIRIPWVGETDGLAAIRKAYSSILKDETCFACERFRVPYPKADSLLVKLKRVFRMDRVSGIQLSTHPTEWFFPLDIRFEMAEQDQEKEVCFKHPATGMTHTLYVQAPTPMELPVGTDSGSRIFLMQAMYEMQPALPKGETLQFHSSIAHAVQKERVFSTNAASSIGIIGGADARQRFIPQ